MQSLDNPLNASIGGLEVRHPGPYMHCILTFFPGLERRTHTPSREDMDKVDHNRSQCILEMVPHATWLPHHIIRPQRRRLGWHAVPSPVWSCTCHVFPEHSCQSLRRLQRHPIPTPKMD